MFQSLGNHEFDNGVSGLTPFIENITSPVLCANLVLTGEPELAREENLKNSIIFNVTSHKVGIIGYLTPDTKILAVQNNVEYIDEIVALKKEVKKLQDEGVNIIIALGHSGYAKDLEIAKEVEGLDLVIGGHSNTFLWNGTVPDIEESQDSYPTYVVQASGRSVPVVQAYAYTKYFGKLLLTFDSNGEVIEADGLPILLDVTVPQDSYVLSIIEKYRSSILLSTEDVIGSTSVVLDNNCGQTECNLGNLITDAMVYYYAQNYVGEHWTDAPIAIMQAGGIRTSIAHATLPTNITYGDLLGVMPFEGNLTTIAMNGTVLLMMLEHSVGNFESIDMPGEFLQFSGLKVVYNVSKPAGSRVVIAKARCWACDVPKYMKVEKKDIYKVIVPGFVANGGDGYSMLKEFNPIHLGYSELACTKYYVDHLSPVYPEIAERITILSSNKQKNSSHMTLNSLYILLFSTMPLFL